MWINVAVKYNNFMIINELGQIFHCYVYINKTTSVTMTSQVLCCNMTLQHLKSWNVAYDEFTATTIKPHYTST